MATDRCGELSPAYTHCQRQEDHDGPHRGQTAAGDVAEWPDDAKSASDIRRKVGDDG